LPAWRRCPRPPWVASGLRPRRAARPRTRQEMATLTSATAPASQSGTLAGLLDLGPLRLEAFLRREALAAQGRHRRTRVHLGGDVDVVEVAAADQFLTAGACPRTCGQISGDGLIGGGNRGGFRRQRTEAPVLERDEKRAGAPQILHSGTQGSVLPPPPSRDSGQRGARSTVRDPFSGGGE